MKTFVVSLLAVSTLAVGAFAIGATAQAGTRTYLSVQVSGLNAQGSIGTARNSENTVEYIGCRTQVTLSTPPELICEASNKLGSHTECSTTNPDFLEVARSISDSSHITFGGTEVQGGYRECTLLIIDNDSRYEPRDL